MEIGGPGGKGARGKRRKREGLGGGGGGGGEERGGGGGGGGGCVCGELEDPFRDKLPLYLSGRIKDAFSRTAF